MRALALVVASLALAVAGCWDSSFHCTRDDQCTLRGVSGRCEPVGYCSFPADSCPSGFSYGAHSPLAGSCVPAIDADMAAPPCGNGTLDPGEACDPMIDSPKHGFCPMPSDCDDHLIERRRPRRQPRRRRLLRRRDQPRRLRAHPGQHFRDLGCARGHRI